MISYIKFLCLYILVAVFPIFWVNFTKTHLLLYPAYTAVMMYLKCLIPSRTVRSFDLLSLILHFYHIIYFKRSCILTQYLHCFVYTFWFRYSPYFWVWFGILSSKLLLRTGYGMCHSLWRNFLFIFFLYIFSAI